MNDFTACAIVNVALISLAGFGIYMTHEWWPLLALLFMASTSRKESSNEK